MYLNATNKVTFTSKKKEENIPVHILNCLSLSLLIILWETVE